MGPLVQKNILYVGMYIITFDIWSAVFKTIVLVNFHGHEWTNIPHKIKMQKHVIIFTYINVYVYVLFSITLILFHGLCSCTCYFE